MRILRDLRGRRSGQDRIERGEAERATQVADESGDGVGVDAVDDAPAGSLGEDEPGVCEQAEVVRGGSRREPGATRDVSGRDPAPSGGGDDPGDGEPGGMREGFEAADARTTVAQRHRASSSAAWDAGAGKRATRSRSSGRVRSRR